MGRGRVRRPSLRAATPGTARRVFEARVEPEENRANGEEERAEKKRAEKATE